MKSSVIELNVGTDFDLDVLAEIIKLNEASNDVKITEVYGSLKTCFLDLPSARPNFRLSASNRQNLERYIAIARDSGITVNYTVNAPFFISVAEYQDKLTKTIEHLRYLESIGIERVIVANPLLMEIISEHTGLAIKVSTIQGINNTSAIKYYSSFNVDRICPDIYVNRNLVLLKSMADEARKYGIELELLANEICLYGDSPCSNILRTSCYMHSALGGNSDHHFNNWPFQRCQEARDRHPICWLKIPYILPQYLKYYQDQADINHFKITGRTNTHEYLLKTVRCYMQKEYTGIIRDLFMLPDNRPRGKSEISTELLLHNGFFDELYRFRSCDYQCNSCHYCDRFAQRLSLPLL